MMRRSELALCWLLCAGGAPALAQVPDDAAQRAQIRSEIRAGRDAAHALYEQQAGECRTRFVVSSCIEAARKQRHDTLAELDRRETALDDHEREQRAIERREAIAKKQADEDDREREAQARARSAEARRDAASEPAAAPRPQPPRAHEGKPPLTAQERAARESSARAAYALKQLQAEARRQEAARRAAEHAKKVKPAAPLPAPGATAAQGVPASAAASQP